MACPPLCGYFSVVGWVAEWFKAAVLKTAGRASAPWVRIPPHPPYYATTRHSMQERRHLHEPGNHIAEKDEVASELHFHSARSNFV